MSQYQHFCTETLDENGHLKHISLQYGDNFNFAYDVLDATAEESPEKTALVWCNALGEEARFTFRDIQEKSNQLVHVLQAEGVQKGDTVLVMLKRHYEYWFVAMALHKMGAILAPVTHMLTVADLRYRAEQGQIHFAICTNEEHAPARFLTLKEEGFLQQVFIVRERVPDCINLSEAMQSAPTTLERIATQVDEPIVTYFTSGTTGQPKGVMHTHSYPLAHIVTAKYWHRATEDGLHFTVAETGWAKASWGKLYGQWLLGSAVMVFDFDNFDPRQLMQIIQKYEVTSFCAPPTIYRYLLKTQWLPMPSLHHLSTAGEPLPDAIFCKIFDKTGLKISVGYGQTESTLLLAQVRPDAPLGSLGKANPLYRLSLVDSENQPVAAGQVGELVVLPEENGAIPVGLFRQYCGNPDLFAEVWRGGVYHTGDTAWQDAEGYFYFEGRADDVIKTGGYRVGPAEIEQILAQHPAVAECAVLGVPDALRGQAIQAFVLLNPAFTPSSQLKKELKIFCNERSSAYKWIRFLDFVEHMPKTISGKIRKKELLKPQ